MLSSSVHLIYFASETCYFYCSAAQSMNGVSDQCWPHAKILICFHTFPTCDSAKKLPANRRFCQDECKFLEQYVCRQEFLLAKSISAIKQFVPSCGTLPQPGSLAHSECLKLPSLNESKFRKFLEKFSIFLSLCES